MSPFEINIRFNHQDYVFQVIKQKWGNSHRYAINIENTGVLFEPDEKSEYRAVVIPGQPKSETIDKALIESIIKELNKIDAANH